MKTNTNKTAFTQSLISYALCIFGIITFVLAMSHHDLTAYRDIPLHFTQHLISSILLVLLGGILFLYRSQYCKTSLVLALTMITISFLTLLAQYVHSDSVFRFWQSLTLLEDQRVLALSTNISFLLTGIIALLPFFKLKLEHLIVALLLAALLLIESVIFSSYLVTYFVNDIGRQPYTGFLESVAFLLWGIMIAYQNYSDQGNILNEHISIGWPVVAFTAILALFTALSLSLLLVQYRHLKAFTLSIQNELASKMTNAIDSEVKAIVRVGKRWNIENGTTKLLWLKDTQNYIEDYEGLKTFLLTDGSFNLIWRQTDDTIATKLPNIQQMLAELTGYRHISDERFKKASVVARNYSDYLLIITPTKATDLSDRYIIAVYSVPELLHSLIPKDIRDKFTVTVTRGDRIIHHDNTGKALTFSDNTGTDMEIANQKWQLQLSPTAKTINNFQTKWPQLLLLIGLLVAGLVAMLIYTRKQFMLAKKDYDLIVNSTGEGLIVTDIDGRIKMMNQTAETLTGYTFNDIAGNKLHPLIHYQTSTHKKYGEDQCRIRPVYQSGESVHNDEEVFWTSQGSSFPVEYIGRPIKRKHNVLGAVITFKDITKRKQIQRRLEERTKELERANKEMEAFSYSVSHDLRAPLRHIMGFIDLIRQNQNISLDDKAKRHFDVICDAAKRMAKLIDELLAFSRAGRFELQMETNDLNTILNEVIEEFGGDIKDRQIEWSIDSLPTLSCDHDKMKLVFQNLIANAIKFTRKRDKAYIDIQCQQKDRQYIISVSDNGVGFDQQYADKIFGVFQRLHTEQEFEGTGIGLANVARVIKRHGGEIWAESGQDQGTTIYLSLPINPGGNNV